MMSRMVAAATLIAAAGILGTSTMLSAALAGGPGTRSVVVAHSGGLPVRGVYGGPGDEIPS